MAQMFLEHCLQLERGTGTCASLDVEKYFFGGSFIKKCLLVFSF